MNKEEESEFGKGLCYCLALFLAHSERDRREFFDAQLWFNGASDHLFDLQVDAAPSTLRDRLTKFRDSAIEFGHAFSESLKPTEKDVSAAVQEAKDLLLLIDKANGVPVAKGSWE